MLRHLPATRTAAVSVIGGGGQNGKRETTEGIKILPSKNQTDE